MVRLTGGEPLVRRNLEVLIAKLAAIDGLDLTLTTNGSLLKLKARALRQAFMSAAGPRTTMISGGLRCSLSVMSKVA